MIKYYIISIILLSSLGIHIFINHEHERNVIIILTIILLIISTFMFFKQAKQSTVKHEIKN